MPGGERIIMGASAVTVLGGGGGGGGADGDAARFVLGLSLNSAQDDALAELDAGLHTWDFGDGAYGIFGMQGSSAPTSSSSSSRPPSGRPSSGEHRPAELYSFASNVQSATARCRTTTRFTRAT